MAYDTTEDQKMQVMVDAVPVLRPSGTSTPEFMIEMDDLLSSNISGYEQAAELLWHHSIERRLTAGHAGGDLKGTSTVEHSMLSVTLLAESWLPCLREKLRNGDNIASVIIHRLANIGDGSELTDIYTTTYEDTKIDMIEEYPDRVNVLLRIKSRTDDSVQVDQDNSQSGNNSSSWDYSTATAGSS
jgi:hypothetical protein